MQPDEIMGSLVYWDLYGFQLNFTFYFPTKLNFIFFFLFWGLMYVSNLCYLLHDLGFTRDVLSLPGKTTCPLLLSCYCVCTVLLVVNYRKLNVFIVTVNDIFSKNNFFVVLSKPQWGYAFQLICGFIEMLPTSRCTEKYFCLIKWALAPSFTNKCCVWGMFRLLFLFS